MQKPKTKVIHIRVSEVQHWKLERMAHRLGSTPGRMAKNIMDRTLTIDDDEEMEYKRYLKRIGFESVLEKGAVPQSERKSQDPEVQKEEPDLEQEPFVDGGEVYSDIDPDPGITDYLGGYWRAAERVCPHCGATGTYHIDEVTIGDGEVVEDIDASVIQMQTEEGKFYCHSCKEDGFNAEWSRDKYLAGGGV